MGLLAVVSHLSSLKLMVGDGSCGTPIPDSLHGMMALLDINVV